MKQILQNIERRVRSSQTLENSIARKLLDTLDACNRHSEAVLRLTKKYATSPATGTWKEKTKELTQRLVFPFEKKTLEELKDIMIAFRGNVDTALGLLQLQVIYSPLSHWIELIVESDISISTQEIVQSLRTDSSTNHQTILGEIQPISEEVSQWKQKLPLLEENLSQKIDNLQRSIENTVPQSSAAVPQSFLPEMEQRLSVLGGSMVDSVTQQIDDSKSAIQATVSDYLPILSQFLMRIHSNK